MKTNFSNSLHNPFQNRFNDPVTRRQDEMQSEAYIALLRERIHQSLNHSASTESQISASQTDLKSKLP